MMIKIIMMTRNLNSFYQTIVNRNGEMQYRWCYWKLNSCWPNRLFIVLISLAEKIGRRCVVLSELLQSRVSICSYVLRRSDIDTIVTIYNKLITCANSNFSIKILFSRSECRCITVTWKTLRATIKKITPHDTQEDRINMKIDSNVIIISILFKPRVNLCLWFP